MYTLRKTLCQCTYYFSDARSQVKFSLIFDSLLLSFPQIEIGTLAPPDYDHPVPEASLEEQEAEEEEEEEVPLKPQLIPQGSGGSGVLMGPDTQKGLKKHIPLISKINLV